METRIKKSIICSGINNYRVDEGLATSYIPQVGDVAIFEVVSIGKHKQIQGDDKRNIMILPGDYIMAAFGTRYATAQFEGYVPEECLQQFHILGAGGTIGIIHSMHSSFKDIGPTVLKIRGYAVNSAGRVINTKVFNGSLNPFTGNAAKAVNIILSVGSSMDSGKTTTAGYLARGLRLKGHKVAYIKLTGTVYTKDRDLVYDCGAELTSDFSLYGFPSTYMCDEQELLDLFETLTEKMVKSKADYVIIEIADGIIQRETKMLLSSKRFMSVVDHVIFSCGDSLSALHGIKTLNDMNIYPVALSGLFTASPLLIKEVKENTNVPVVTIEEWMTGAFNHLFSSLKKQHA